MENISCHTHKTGSWYLLDVLFKISAKHPCPFYMEGPPWALCKLYCMESVLSMRDMIRSGHFSWVLIMVYASSCFLCFHCSIIGMNPGWRRQSKINYIHMLRMLSLSPWKYTPVAVSSPEPAHFGSRVIKCVTHWTRTRKSWFLFDCARQLKLNNGFKCA